MRIASFALLMAMLAVPACEIEQAVISSENESGVSLAISIDSIRTRSILEDEGVDSGFYLMIYRSESGEFVDCISYESRSGGELILRKGDVYDIYVLGNMWYVDSDGGRRTLKDIGVTSVSDYAYRFDGGTAGGGLRRESFSEIVKYGIPYSGMVKRVKAEEGASVNISCSYLFAKLSVTVDHSGLVNGNVAESVFRNSKLYVRGANSIVKPFASSVKAASASDLLAVSDYSATMANGGKLSFIYYVPENCQGSDASVTDPLQKTTEKKALATYIEFETVVDGAAGTAGGYGGTFTYQFCLGANATTDFNVIRGSEYDVSLAFRAGSLFNPEWKVSNPTGDWSDTRTIRFSADNAGSSASLLKDDGTQILAVRKNRPAQCYVYFNRSGAAGSNERASYLDYLTIAQAATYNPSNVSRSGYSLTYDSAVLSQYGMSLSYDSSTGKITVSYNSASAGAANFLNVPAAGIPVTVTLHPGGKTVTALVKTYENLSLSVTSGDKYVGMKTHVQASGFAGNNVKVSSSNGSVFRTSNSASGDGSEGTDKYLGSTPVTLPSSGLDIYAYRNAGSVTLSCNSEDSFNDGVQSTTLTVYKPTLALDKTSYLIPVDGTEVDVEYSYRDRNNAKMQQSAFDSAVYSQLMTPQLSLSDPTSGAGTYARATVYCDINTGTVSQVYAKKLPLTTGGAQPTTDTPLGYVNVRGRNATLFPNVSANLKFRYPSWVSGFSDIKSNMFNEQMPTEENAPLLSTSAVIDAAGCSPENFKGSDGSQTCGYTIVSGNDFSTQINTEDVGYSLFPNLLFRNADSQGRRTLTWSWKPSARMCLNNGINAPWGERSVSPTIFNKHYTGETGGTGYVMHGPVANTFDISYRTLQYVRLVIYHLNTNESYCYVCSRLSADVATKNFEADGRTGTFPAPPVFMQMHPVMQGRQFTVRDWTSSMGGEIVNCSGSYKLLNDIRVFRCILDRDPFLTPESREYEDSVWDEGLIDDQRRTMFALPGAIGFGQTSQLGGPTSLDFSEYPGEDDEYKQKFQVHIPISCMNSTLVQYVYE